jgi:hypothetical protein
MAINPARDGRMITAEALTRRDSGSQHVRMSWVASQPTPPLTQAQLSRSLGIWFDDYSLAPAVWYSDVARSRVTPCMTRFVLVWHRC